RPETPVRESGEEPEVWFPPSRCETELNRSSWPGQVAGGPCRRFDAIPAGNIGGFVEKMQQTCASTDVAVEGGDDCPRGSGAPARGTQACARGYTRASEEARTF